MPGCKPCRLVAHSARLAGGGPQTSSVEGHQANDKNLKNLAVRNVQQKRVACVCVGCMCVCVYSGCRRGAGTSDMTPRGRTATLALLRNFKRASVARCTRRSKRKPSAGHLHRGVPVTRSVAPEITAIKAQAISLSLRPGDTRRPGVSERRNVLAPGRTSFVPRARAAWLVERCVQSRFLNSLVSNVWASERWKRQPLFRAKRRGRAILRRRATHAARPFERPRTTVPVVAG